MSYLLPLVLAIALNAVDRLITRATLRRHHQPMDFLVVYQLFSTGALVPVALAAVLTGRAVHGTPSTAWVLVALVTASVTFWAAYAILTFKSSALVELSVTSTISRLRLVFVAVLGVLIFGEHVTAIHAAGLVIILAAQLPLNRLPQQPMRGRGALYALLATAAISLAQVFDKYLVLFLQTGLVVFIGFVGSTVVGLVVNRGYHHDTSRVLFRQAGATGLCGAFGYYMLVEALARGAASVVLPIYQLTGVVYALAGVVLLGERDGWPRKLFSAVVAMTGCLIVIVGSRS